MNLRTLTLSVCLLGCISASAKEKCKEDPGKSEKVGMVVHAESKKPIKDVTITAFLDSKKEKLAQTDKSGIYSMNKLRPGTYKIVFEKPGFKKVTKDNVVIKDEESFHLNIEMMEHYQYEIQPSPLQFTDF